MRLLVAAAITLLVVFVPSSNLEPGEIEENEYQDYTVGFEELFLKAQVLPWVEAEKDGPISGFVQVTDGCEVVPTGCLNVRLGPGTEYKRTHSLRIGAIVEVDERITEENGRVWYRIKQNSPLRYPERIEGRWYIAAEYVRFVFPPEVISSPENSDKKIVIDLSEQKLMAYEGDELVIETLVSTGKSETETPKGVFRIFIKKPSSYMQGPLPDMTDYYDLPGIPWTMYFTSGGAAIHGAYWHNDFGRKHSHGCVNLPIDKAEELYRWAEIGTKVVVVE